MAVIKVQTLILNPYQYYMYPMENPSFSALISSDSWPYMPEYSGKRLNEFALSDRSIYIKIRFGFGHCFTPYQRLWLYNGAPSVAFYDTLGIRRTYSRLKPPASSRGGGGGIKKILKYIYENKNKTEKQ